MLDSDLSASQLGTSQINYRRPSNSISKIKEVLGGIMPTAPPVPYASSGRIGSLRVPPTFMPWTILILSLDNPSCFKRKGEGLITIDGTVELLSVL